MASPALGQAPLRKLGEMELALLGVGASVEPERPVLPRNIPAAVRVVVRAGGVALSPDEVKRFLGDGLQVQAELSGPGLAGTLTLPLPAEPGTPPVQDPLLLPTPPLAIVGEYTLANVRIVRNGVPVLDVTPNTLPVQVSEILITAVQTRALTLDEIRARGIVLDSDDYLGFDFIIGMRFDSQPVNFSFPVVFDRNGIAVPLPLTPPSGPIERDGIRLPTIVPLLLDVDPGDGPAIEMVLPNPQTGAPEPIRIPSVLVIPGDVGYLKQFFAAQLFVSNGAPGWSTLTLHDVQGTIKLPEGPEPGPADDPLALPDILRDGVVVVQPKTMTLYAAGPDGTPGAGGGTLQPGQQGMAEFLLRGEKEGFHNLEFDIAAVLEGLPSGPVNLKGKARGGVLVRNPFFDMAFTLPAIVRAQEEFNVYVTVTNKSQALANDLTVSIDQGAMAGAHLKDPNLGSQSFDTLRPGDSTVLTFRMVAEITGQVVASYLRLDTAGTGPNDGTLNFTVGVGERGVPLSPDTLVLPSAVDALPRSVVDAAMRVLGQAWSLANAPAGTVPAGVTRTSRKAVTQKALALAEGGLRVQLGQPIESALRDVLLDFYGSDQRQQDEPTLVALDKGFDQLLRTTTAGRDLARALGLGLRGASNTAGGPLPYEGEIAAVAAAGTDFVTFAVEGDGGTWLPMEVSFRDGGSLRTLPDNGQDIVPQAEIPGAVIVPLGPPASAPLLGLLTAPAGGRYTLELVGRRDGSGAVSLTFPDGHNGFRRLDLSGLEFHTYSRTSIFFTPGVDTVLVKEDLDASGSFEVTRELQAISLPASGPQLQAARVIGPEVLSGASPFGLQAVLVFDRLVDATAAARVDAYAVPKNGVHSAKRQLSGRLVFLTLKQPEGPCLDTSVALARAALTERGIEGPLDSVPMTSMLKDTGARVFGRIFEADGTPVASGDVYYTNNLNLGCASPPGCTIPDESGLSQVPLAEDGTYEFRYVRQDRCGCPFTILAKDPRTGAQRRVVGHVLGNTGGALCAADIEADIALLGRGSVGGVVRDLAGARVAGAVVNVKSVEDHQSGGTTHSGPDGSYLVNGITVGQVTTQAAHGNGVGLATGRIDRAGTTATVDVVLDGGVVNLSGTVLQSVEGEVTAAAGVTLIYFYEEQVAGFTVLRALAATSADQSGHYAFAAMPVGNFVVTAYHPTGQTASVAGTAVLGNNPDKNLLLVIPTTAQLGIVRGTVKYADGTPARGVWVRLENLAAKTDDVSGSYELRRVPVKPYQAQKVNAKIGRRSGEAPFILDTPGQIVEGVDVRLSGLGTARFVVKDVSGNPLRGQTVRVFSNCLSACGCSSKVTDDDGAVEYSDMALGTVVAQAVGNVGGAIDVARGAVTLRSDDDFATGVLQYAGAGSVVGLVRNPPQGTQTQGGPSHGATVRLYHSRFDPFSCSLGGAVSTVVTGVDGRFQFAGINLGRVSLTASQDFLPTPVGASGLLTTPGQVLPFELQLVESFAAELQGDVYLPDGTTLAGAGVEVVANGPLPDVTVRTDAQGHYHFAEILPAGTYTLTARDPLGAGMVRDVVALRVGVPTTFNLRLKGRGKVRVTVVDGSEQPLTAAVVRLTESEFPRRSYELTVAQGQQGVAEFGYVFEGPFSVEAFDPFNRGGRASGLLPGPGQTVDIKLRVSTTGKVRGRYLMPGGAPIPYAVVKLLKSGRVLGQITTAGSGPDLGSFGFDYVPAGSFRLEAQDPLTARNGVATGEIQEEGQTITVDVNAEGLGLVQGVVTRNDNPQPGAQVRLDSGGFHASTMSDDDGTYVVSGVPVGRVTATATLGASGLAGTASGNVDFEGHELTLPVPLHDSADVNGRVRRWDGSIPGPASSVTIGVGGFGGGSQTTSTLADGTYAFHLVPAGLATLNADVFSSIDVGRVTGDVVAPGPVQLDVTLNGVGALTGNLVGLDPSWQAWITLTRAGPFPDQQGLELGLGRQFHLSEVLAGPFTARLYVRTPENVSLYGNASGEVVADSNANTFTIETQPTGAVTGRVVRGNGDPAIGTDVLIWSTPPFGSQARTHTDNAGYFTARGIPLGALEVRANDLVTGGLAVARGLAVQTNGQLVDVGTLTLDSGLPTIQFLEPVPGSTRAAFSGPFQALLTDLGSGIDTTSFTLSKSLVTPPPVTIVAGTQPGTWVLSGKLYGNEIAVGSNTLVASVKDLAGNQASAQMTFTVTGGTITGHVSAPNGGDNAGNVPVRVDGGASTHTDDLGMYTLSGLRPSTYGVRATDPLSGLEHVVPVSLGDGETKTVNLALPSFGHIDGFVKTAGGQPARDVTVTTPGRSAETDSTGHFNLGNFTLSPTPYTLQATRANGDHATASVLVDVAGAPRTAQLTLNGIGALTVHVRHFGGGADVEDAQVSVQSSSPFGGNYLGATRDGGLVTFPQVLAGTLTVHASFMGLNVDQTLVLGDTQALTTTLELPAAATLGGFVRAAVGGAGIQGATVNLSGPRLDSTTTDGQGHYSFSNVPLGNFTLAAVAPDGDRGQAQGVLNLPGQSVGADISLTGFGSVTVTVTSAGNPVDGADVTVTSSKSGSNPLTGKTGPNGIASFPKVFAGTITSSARAGNATGQTSGALTALGNLPLSVSLQAVGSITGRLMTTDGSTPVVGAKVKVTAISGEVTTGTNGVFLIENVLPGTYRLQAHLADSERLRVVLDGVAAVAGQTTQLGDLRLVGLGTVTGTVTRSGSPVGTATVTLQSAAPIGGTYQTTTSAVAGTVGQYTIANVPVGNFDVSVSQGGDAGQAAGTLPADNATATANVALVPATVSLPTSPYDGNGLYWTLYRNGGLNHGVMFTGTDTATTPRLSVRVGAGGSDIAFLNATGNLASSEEGRHELVLDQPNLGGLHVTRKIFIPGDGYFLRYLDLIENTGASSTTVDVLEEAAFGIASSVVATQSGGVSLSAADGWATIDDGNTSDVYAPTNFPQTQFAPLAAVFRGQNGTAPSDASFTPAQRLLRTRWNALQIPAGGRIAILQIFSAQADRPRAQAAAERLVALPPELLAGLTPSEAAAVVNFALPLDLTSALPALPGNDGEISGTLRAFDAATIVKQGNVQFRSSSRFYGRPLSVSTSNGAFAFAGAMSTFPTSAAQLVPRTGFTVTAAHTLISPSPTAQATGDFAGAPQTQLDVVFGGTGILRGRVRRDDGTGLIGASLSLEGLPSTSVSLFSAGPDGAFEYPVLPARSYSLKATHSLGSPSVTVAAVGVSADHVTVQDLVFTSLGQVTVNLHNSLGAAASGSCNLSGPGLNSARFLNVPIAGATFLDVPQGTYALTCTHSVSRAVVVQSVTAIASQTTPVVVTFPPVGRILVTATLGGARLPGANVFVQADARGINFESVGAALGDGTLTIPNVPGPNFQVRVEYPSSAYPRQVLSGSITAEAESVPLLFELPAAGSITGVLRARDGTAVQGSVYAYSEDGTILYRVAGTQADGSFTLSDVPVGPVRVRATVFPPSNFSSLATETQVTNAAQPQLTIDPLLAPVDRITTADAPRFWSFEAQAGQSVSLWPIGRAYAGAQALSNTRADVYSTDGSFTLHDDDGFVVFTAPVGGGYVLAVRGGPGQVGGYTLARYSSNPSTYPGVFKAFEGGHLAGQVRRGTAGGSTVEGQRLRLKLGAAIVAEATTGPSGYAIEMYPPGTYTLEALEPDGAVSASVEVQVPAPGQAVAYDVVVPARGDVQAFVTRSGVPAPADISVTFTSDNPDATMSDRTRVALTAADGYTPFRSLPTGTISASVVDPQSGATVVAQGQLAEGGSIAIPVSLTEGTATLEGVIYARDGETPLAGASVWLVNHGDTVTDENGRYVFTNVVPGTRDLGAYFYTYPYGASESVTIDVPAAGTTIHSFTLPVAILRGHVLEAGGAPVSGAELQACAYYFVYPYYYLPYCVQPQTTGTDGSYAWIGLPTWAPFWPVVVSMNPSGASWLSATQSFYFYASSTATVTLDFTLPATGNVTGVVLDDSSGAPTPVASAFVHLTHPSGLSLPDLTADENGRFSLARVPAGALRIYAEDPVDRIPGALERDLAADENAEVEVHLVPAETLTGVRRGENQAPAPGDVQITALQAPARDPNTAWSVMVSAPEPDAVFSRRIPAGAWRAVAGFESCLESSGGLVGADEGNVVNQAPAYPTLGTHQCHMFTPGQPFADVVPTSAEPFPPIGSTDAAGQTVSLRVGAGNVLARTRQFEAPTGRFLRTFTSFTNVGSTPTQVIADVGLGLGYQLSDIAVSSDGNSSFETSDGWLVIGYSYDSNQQSLLVLGDRLAADSVIFFEGFSGGRPQAGGSINAGQRVSYSNSYATGTYTLTLQPGETRALLAFSARTNQGEDLTGLAADLLALREPGALDGLSVDERAAIANFVSQQAVTGVVKDGADPVPGAHVGALALDGSVAGQTDADQNGAFVLDLAQGSYTLVAVDVASNRPGRLSVDVLEAAQDVGIIQLVGASEAGTVTVVVDPPSGAYEGTPVELQVQGYWPIWTAAGTFDAMSQASFAVVPPASLGAISTLGSATGTLGPAGALSLTIHVGTGTGSVSGRVVESDGRGVAGARVALLQSYAVALESASAGDGNFILTGVPEGTYDVVAVDGPTNRPARGYVEVTAQTAASAGDLVLPARDQVGQLNVQGVVEPGSGATLPGAFVWLWSSGCCDPYWPGPLYLDDNGQAQIRGIPAGWVAAEIGYAPDFGWQDGTLAAGGTLQVEVRVGNRGYAGNGIDLTGADGLPYSVHGQGEIEMPGAIGTLADGFTWRHDAQLLQGGRETLIGPRVPDGSNLVVNRRQFVPPSGRFARLLDVLDNPTNAPIDVNYALGQSLQATGDPWSPVLTSSGDASFDATDTYAVFARNEAATPALATVIQGDGWSGPAPGLFWWDQADNRYWRTEFAVSVPAHGRLILMQFLVQRAHGETVEAQSQAQALATLSDPEALTGLSPQEVSAIVNFNAP